MFNVITDADSVYLRDGDQEIVMWTLDEWREDPKVVLSITAAIRLGYEQGPDAVRAALA
ncbi:hypothetical protein ACFW2V_13375 [Streptomyces sp. NPDC058947]|uniref:hypothetical protein n=1 Tax=Streptomyces sp. NPDC058947 TaxID=3346675 RepID=UPI0036AF7AFF